MAGSLLGLALVIAAGALLLALIVVVVVVVGWLLLVLFGAGMAGVAATEAGEGRATGAIVAGVISVALLGFAIWLYYQYGPGS